VIRPPTLWKPSPVELDPLRAEWVKFRDEIRAGRADRLPPASTTRMIHVRPHARDSKDTEEAPGVGPVVKKSFWLNREFVAQLIQDSMGS
jgi:DNA mismatch repair protein MutH